MTKGKKDFKDAAKRFISNAEQDTPDTHDTPSAQETQITHDTPDTQRTHDTQGNRKQKHPRINMAFYGKNLEYLELVSRIEGVSITQYVNDLISKDEEHNRERVQTIKSMLKGKGGI